MILAANMENIGIGNAAIVALLGYAVVFIGLTLLMLVILAMGHLFRKKEERSSHQIVNATVPIAEYVQLENVSPEVAPGAAGHLKLYDVEPKTAAMIMAIVAYKIGRPINELRFVSIKEVKGDEI